ncbi:flavin reductase family protein [Roseomonas elaeocarpi]|uniref:Flavin reductase family protein n=1 Tax=Roseomonas elaeocarpi TaxID=907779 RepID=A0ABV6JTM0_9PROT
MSQASETAPSLSQSFRAAMGCFTTGVTIVTSCSTAGPVGMTANSLTSVSLDPSLLLVCLKKGGLTGEAIRAHRSFAINLLAEAQEDLAMRFARPSDNRFGGVEVDWDARGVPLIHGSAAHIVCDLHAVHDAGDHEIFLGQVVSSVHDKAIEPLVFRAGRFGTYQPRAVPA